MSDILFDVSAYTSRPNSFTDYELDTQGWDDQPPPVARPATGQNTGNSLGFKEGSRIHLTLHPSKIGTISHYHKPIGGWWVNWDNGNNYAVPGESLELDPNSLGFKESDRSPRQG